LGKGGRNGEEGKRKKNDKGSERGNKKVNHREIEKVAIDLSENRGPEVNKNKIRKGRGLDGKPESDPLQDKVLGELFI
jgi:hypothetical protein